MKKKIIYSFLFVLCLLFIFNSTAFASSIYDYFSGSGKSNVDMETVTSNVYTILYTFGIILAVCILVTIAISYMVATPNKKAQLKERLIYYFAGVIFLVGGLAFLRTYEKVAKEIGNQVGGSSSGVQSPTSSDYGAGYTNEDGEWVYNDTTIQSIKESTDIPWDDIKKMDYNSLKDYVNALDKNVREFKKMIEKQGSSISSGEQETLDRAETRLENAYDRLVELKTLQSGN